MIYDVSMTISDDLNVVNLISNFNALTKKLIRVRI